MELRTRPLLCTSLILLTAYVKMSDAGEGEKVRINPEDLEKIIKYSNLTQRDKTEKNVNFAWKVTMRSTLPTTMDPALTSTLNAQQKQQNNEIYDKLFAQLAYTLRDKVYLDRWLKEIDKGYHIFLYEIQKQDRSTFFKKFEGEDIFAEANGDRNWWGMMKMLQGIGNKENFLDVLEQIHGTTAASNGTTLGAAVGAETTTDTYAIRKPSASDEAAGKPSAWNIMQIHLALTLTADTFRRRWNEALRSGFNNFIRELKEKGPKEFIKLSPDDKHFQGVKGGLYWTGIVGYLQKLGAKGIRRLIARADSLPDEVSAQEILAKKLMEVT